MKRLYKTAFLSAFLIGLLTHLAMIVHWYPNADAMTNCYFDQNMITSGRWFLQVACGISSYYNLPVVIGFLSLCYLALTVVVVVDLFGASTVPIAPAP